MAETTVQDAPAPENASVEALLEASDEKLREAKPDAQTAEKQAGEDWKAKHDALEATVRRQEQELRTLQGRQRSRQGEEEFRDEMREAISALAKTTAAIVKHRATEDDEALSREFDEISQQSAKSRSETSFQRAADLVAQEVFEAVKDEDGRQMIEPATAPEFNAFRQQFQEAYQAKDKSGLYLALNEAHRVTKRLERERLKARHQTELKAAKEEKKKALEDAEVNNVDVVGGESPGVAGGGNSTEIWKAYGRGDLPWSARVQKAGKALGVLSG